MEVLLQLLRRGAVIHVTDVHRPGGDGEDGEDGEDEVGVKGEDVEGDKDEDSLRRLVAAEP